MYCQNCGVELEYNMAICPLCGRPAGDNKYPGEGQEINIPANPSNFGKKTMTGPQKKFTWEIVSIILLSGAIASFIVDFIISNHLTWSEYTVAIGLTIFSYVSLFAFSNQPTINKVMGGFFSSSLFLLLLDALTGGINWSLRLAIPLLFGANLIVVLFLIIIQRSRFKGINLISYAFIAAALLCLFTEATLRFFENKSIHLRWSIIVLACVTPIAMVLFFVHVRFKKGRNLKKTFHI